MLVLGEPLRPTVSRPGLASSRQRRCRLPPRPQAAIKPLLPVCPVFWNPHGNYALDIPDGSVHELDGQAGFSESELQRGALEKALCGWRDNDGTDVWNLYAALSHAVASSKSLYWRGGRKVDLPPMSVYVHGHEVHLPQWAVIRGARELELAAEVDVSLEDYAEAAASFFEVLVEEGFLFSQFYTKSDDLDTGTTPQCIQNTSQSVPEE